MINGDSPINAIFNDKGGAITDGDLMAGRKQFIGLTKREYFAGLAMQGLLSNPFYMGNVLENVENKNEMLILESLDMADELLNKLEK